nr:uncharacterized protein LOC106684684 [Halyomorpha halys]
MGLRDRNCNGPVDFCLSYLRNETFIFTLLIAVLCLAIDILWGYYEYPPGMLDFSGYVLFAHAAPAFTVIFWCLVLGYLFNEEPPPKLQLIYSTSGALLFTVIVILQTFNFDDYTGHKMTIVFWLHVAVLLLFVLHLVFLVRRYYQHKDLEERPYIIRVSRGGVPVYR